MFQYIDVASETAVFGPFSIRSGAFTCMISSPVVMEMFFSHSRWLRLMKLMEKHTRYPPPVLLFSTGVPACRPTPVEVSSGSPASFRGVEGKGGANGEAAPIGRPGADE